MGLDVGVAPFPTVGEGGSVADIVGPDVGANAGVANVGIVATGCIGAMGNLAGAVGFGTGIPFPVSP